MKDSTDWHFFLWRDLISPDQDIWVQLWRRGEENTIMDTLLQTVDITTLRDKSHFHFYFDIFHFFYYTVVCMLVSSDRFLPQIYILSLNDTHEAPLSFSWSNFHFHSIPVRDYIGIWTILEFPVRFTDSRFWKIRINPRIREADIKEYHFKAYWII